MANRFGRRRKRALEQKLRDAEIHAAKRIKELETLAFGPAGRCPDDIPSIDDLAFDTKTIRIEDSPMAGYRVSVDLDGVPIKQSDEIDRLYGLRERPVRLDGRCLIAVNFSMPNLRSPFAVPFATISFQQIVPPARHRR